MNFFELLEIVTYQGFRVSFEILNESDEPPLFRISLEKFVSNVKYYHDKEITLKELEDLEVTRKITELCLEFEKFKRK